MNSGLPFQLKFYSAATKLQSDANSIVSLASVQALSGVVSYTVNCTKINYKELQEGDVIEGVGGYKAEDTRVRGVFDIRTEQFDVNSQTEANSYFSLLKALRKPAKYMSILKSIYPTDTRLFGTTLNAVSINVTDISFDEENGKILTISVEKDRNYGI